MPRWKKMEAGCCRARLLQDASLPPALQGAAALTAPLYCRWVLQGVAAAVAYSGKKKIAAVAYSGSIYIFIYLILYFYIFNSNKLYI